MAEHEVTADIDYFEDDDLIFPDEELLDEEFETVISQSVEEVRDKF